MAKSTSESRYTADVGFTDLKDHEHFGPGSYAEMILWLSQFASPIATRTVSTVNIGRVIAEGTIGDFVRHD